MPPTSSTVPAAAEFPTQVTTFRQFGSWLDDASAAERGQGYASISAGYWRLAGLSQTNVPMMAAGLGVTDRMQVSASVPFYRLSYDGTTSRGLDDVYLSAKYTLIDPTLTISEFGLAVSPVLEVLSAGWPGGRVHFAFPVSMEIRRLPFRVYGAAGYFTRGAFFSGGAVEWTSPNGVTLTGGLIQSYSTMEDAVLDTLAIGRQRVDVHGTVARAIGNTVGVSISVGRSLTSLEEGGTSLAISGGIAFRFRTEP
jgi:hypothetical protein